MLGYLFDMPEASSTFASIGEWSKPVFSDFLPIALLGIGVSFAIFAIITIVKLFFGHKDKD